MAHLHRKKNGKGKKPAVIEGEAANADAGSMEPIGDAASRAIAHARELNERRSRTMKGRPSNNPKGKPSDYNEKIAEDILCDIANGMTVTQICKQKGMPSERTFRRWQVNYPQFAERVILAHRSGMISMLDHIRDIAHRRCDKELRSNGEDEEIKNADRDLAIQTEFLTFERKKAVLGLTEIIGPMGGMPGDNAKLVNPQRMHEGMEVPRINYMELAARGFKEETGIEIRVSAKPTAK